MNAIAENALRSVARRCREEMIAATAGKPISEHDKIHSALLDKHAKSITALPPDTFPAKRWLSYYVRQIDREIRAC